MSLSQALDKSAVPSRTVLINPELVGTVTTGSIVATPSVTAAFSALQVGNSKQSSSISTDGVSSSVTTVSPLGTSWRHFDTYEDEDGHCDDVTTVATWDAVTNYGGIPNNLTLVRYGTNTAAPGAYPNNIFYPYVPAGVAVVGVPPTATLPLPAVPVPSAGWGLAASANFSTAGGATTVGEDGKISIEERFVSAYAPARIQWFGGGADSVDAARPLGMTLFQSSTTTAQANNGAKLQVSGSIRADGFAFAPTNQSLCPASSYGAKTNEVVPNTVVFQMGYTWTWTAPAPGGTSWGWVRSGAGGTGTAVIDGGTNASFSPDSLVFLQSEVEFPAGSAKGILSVQAKTNTSVTIQALSTTNAIETGDSSFFQWMVINPDWSN